MGVVFVATDRLTRQNVALKRLHVPERVPAPSSSADATATATSVSIGNGQDSPSPSADSTTLRRLALAQEFRLLASLRHPNIISVLDYGFEEGYQPFFTMEIVPSALTFIEAAKDRPLGEKVHLIGQVLEALIYLHRRNTLHRDLKPANVLVSEGRVRVLDFGLATHVSQAVGKVGTPRYMAPEILLGQSASTASDLFSLGVMAYEVLTGAYPFPQESSRGLTWEIIHAMPDLGQVDQIDRALPAGAPAGKLRELIARLLTKEPAQRFQDARQALIELHAATGHAQAPESRAIRESYLQTAQFVGRDEELHILASALAKTKAGHGSSWLIAGESGVGKTRLSEELRIRALVGGAAVWTGQAVSEAGRAYQEWREPLLRLAVTVGLEDREAGVLAALFPDIGDLLGVAVAPLPATGPQQFQEMLLGVIDALLGRVRDPALILLQDLHWSGAESFAVLNHVNRAVENLPVMVVATYRDDEAPDLPARAPGMQILKLRRLPEAAIAELSESILGPRGRTPEVLEFLQRQTEGNVFFLVEVVRSLAESAGRLEEAFSSALPEHVVTSGISRIIHHRLDRVPESDRRLLELAAVAGRRIQLELLSALEPQRDITQWLHSCADCSVLNLAEAEWQFAHDQLREAVLERMVPERKSRIHYELAETIERLHPDDDRMAAMLAYHWGQAGHGKSELRWTMVAGAQMLQAGAYARAIEYANRALQLLPQIEDPAQRVAQETTLQLNLGTAYLVTKGHASPEMKRAFDRAGELCREQNDLSQLFRVLFGQSTFYLFRGELDSARELATQCLAMAESTGVPDLIVQSSFALGNALYWQGEFSAAEEHTAKILELWHPGDHVRHIAQFGHNPRLTLLTFTAWSRWARGFPDQALALAHEAMEMAEHSGHGFSRAIAIQILAFVHQFRNEPVETQQYAEMLLEMASEYPTYRIAGQILRGWALVKQDQIDQGIEEIEEAWDMWHSSGAGLAHGYYSLLLAEAYRRLGKARVGLALVESALTEVRKRHELCHESELLRVRGELLQTLPERQDLLAEESLTEALEVARSQGAKSLELQAALSLAALWIKQGKSPGAGRLLRSVYEKFDEGYNTVDLQLAKSQIEACS
jgi:predicted ATPase/tRNA A-37 threonylcarbamoyl transferase component Bud32